ncbi:MAG: threonine synthase [Arenicellaceae bacterium]|nr:threonine synthase [Arenicellaceae bacterium]
MYYTGLIDKYRSRLPLSLNTPAVSLSEGDTPLIKLSNIPKDLGIDVDLYVKYEGLNPTGSFKDRGMTVAVTRAAELGSKSIICASTGNTSASAAAYAARAGMTAFVLIPDGKIALGKLAQAMMHGAQIIQIRGNFDDGMQLVKEISIDTPITLVNSVNPYRTQGQKTAAFEVVDALGRAPDYHCLPVGNAGNISAYWMGYTEYSCDEDSPWSKSTREPDANFPYFREKVVNSRPIMVGYQAAGAAPLVNGEPMDKPETVATAIRIGRPQSWDYAVAARDESGGWFDAMTDEEILTAQNLLANREGIFVEPASAASIAGVMQDLKSGKIPAGSTIVCTVTGHGLKDPDTAVAQSPTPVTVDANLDAVKRLILVE